MRFYFFIFTVIELLRFVNGKGISLRENCLFFYDDIIICSLSVLSTVDMIWSVGSLLDLS